MTRLCSWCPEALTSFPRTETGVSHALCPNCLQDLQRELAANGLRVGGQQPSR